MHDIIEIPETQQKSNKKDQNQPKPIAVIIGFREFHNETLSLLERSLKKTMSVITYRFV